MLSREGNDSIPLAVMEHSAVDLTAREYVHFPTEPNILMDMKQCINGSYNVLNLNQLIMSKIKTLIKKIVKSDLEFYGVQDQLKNNETAFINYILPFS